LPYSSGHFAPLCGAVIGHYAGFARVIGENNSENEHYGSFSIASKASNSWQIELTSVLQLFSFSLLRFFFSLCCYKEKKK